MVNRVSEFSAARPSNVELGLCVFLFAPAGVNFGGVGGREDTFRKVIFVSGGSRKSGMRLQIALIVSARVRVE